MERMPGAFTRKELDAAEPERPRSLRRRWLLGFVLGAVGGVVAGWVGPISLLALAALPWALTPAGAAVLVGSGLVWAIYLVVLGGEIGRDGIAAWPVNVVVPAVLLGVGLLGTVVAWRRGNAR
jgi:drug/metabolite transporter (DMT)-like permease